MRGVLRSVAAVLVALLGIIALAVAWTTATAVQLAASALIMGGSDHPLSTPPDDPVLFINPYLNSAVTEYINPAADVPSGTAGGERIDKVDGNVYAVVYPAEFFPVFGNTPFDESVAAGVRNLRSCVRGNDDCEVNRDEQIDPQPPSGPPAADDELVIFGYSQSAVIASLLKRELIEDPRQAGTSFFLLANPMRPNGGILARGPQGLTIPILEVTFYGATPTDSCETGPCMPTVDVAAQYDFLGGDAPASLTNLLAILNAAAGSYYLHGELPNGSLDDALYQASYGDTDYYLIPATRLPILMPFEGLLPSPILTLLDAPLRVLIEGAYRRDVNPGIPTGVDLLPFHNPIQTVLNFLAAIPTAIDDALAEAVGDPEFRPLGTSPTTSPFGVGGPDLPAPPEAQPVDADALDVAPVGRSEEDPANEAVGDGSTGDVVTAEEVGTEGIEDEAVNDEAVNEDKKQAEPTSPPADPADKPQRPKVRGPIEFDSRELGDAPSVGDTDAPGMTTGELGLDDEGDEGDDAADGSGDADDAEGSESQAAA